MTPYRDMSRRETHSQPLSPVAKERPGRRQQYLTPLYLFVLIIVAVLALLAYAGSYVFSNIETSSASAIALTHQQRTLTQRVALLSFELTSSRTERERAATRQMLDEAIRQMEQTQAELVRISLSSSGFNWPPPTIQLTLFASPARLDERVRAYLMHAKAVLTASDSALNGNNPDLAYILDAAQRDLATALDELANQYETEDMQLAARLQQVETLLTGFILFLLLILSLSIFRPMLQHVEQDTRKLMDSQQLLDAVLNTVGEAIVTVDLNNVIVRANQEVENIWGYSPTELIGEKLQKLLAPRYRETHNDASDIRHLGRRIELEGLKKDGSVFPLEMRITKTMTDDAVLFTAAMREITESKRAEERIRHQLTTIQALYNSSQKLAESRDLEALAADITRTCVEEFGARQAWLARAEVDGMIRPFAQYPPNGDDAPQLIARWDDPDDPSAQGPSGRAIRSRAPVVIDDIAREPTFKPWRGRAAAQGVRSIASFPLISGDRPFGTLQLHSDQLGFFTPERIEFFQSYAHQAAAALENARLIADDRRRLERMQALRTVDMAIMSSPDLRVTLNVLLDQVVNHLNADATLILLLNPFSQALEHAAHRGFRSSNIIRSRLRVGQGHAGRAVLERKIISVADLSESQDDPTRATLLLGEGFVSYYAVPLIVKGQVKGVLEIFHRTALTPDADWLNFLEALAAQAAIAIDNAALFESLQRSNLELVLAYDDTLQGWSTALDLRDRETEGHTVRVTALAVRLARELGLNDSELVHIHRGGLLHDIGKMGIPDQILLKTGPLTEDEWAIMRMHPIYAYEMLSPIAYLRPALDIPHCHHERWDGTGYPRGLKGEQIPLAARIFAVADVWDALTMDRPYRKAWPEEKALQYIRVLAGSAFDPHVVQTFVEMMSKDKTADTAIVAEDLAAVKASN